MSAYPSHPIGLESKQEIESSYQDDISTAGTLHSRQMRSAQYYRFELIHPGLSATNFNSLLATYQAGPRSTYTLTYRQDTSPIETYSVVFLEPPQIVANHGNQTHDVRVVLRGTKD